jgi:hypothetical protein
MGHIRLSIDMKERLLSGDSRATATKRLLQTFSSANALLAEQQLQEADSQC